MDARALSPPPDTPRLCNALKAPDEARKEIPAGVFGFVRTRAITADRATKSAGLSIAAGPAQPQPFGWRQTDYLRNKGRSQKWKFSQWRLDNRSRRGAQQRLVGAVGIEPTTSPV
jgi:hypothetical protein